MSQPTPARTATRRSAHDWWLLAAALLALLVFGLWSRQLGWDGIDREERQRLEVQASAIDQNLSLQFASAASALRSVQAALGDGSAGTPAEVSRRLAVLAGAVPGVDTVSVLDAAGVVSASSSAALIGSRAGEAEFFVHARGHPDQRQLYLSPPFRTAAGVYTMHLTVVVPDAAGGFGGAVTAMLDPAYFQVVLHSVRYAPDMWAGLVHGDGGVLMFDPPQTVAAGANLDEPDSLFRRHRKLSQPSTVLGGRLPGSSTDSLLAQRTVLPPGLLLDKPLVVAVGRDVGAIFAPWRELTAIYTLLYAVFAAAAVFGLWALQRRAADTQRLHLAQDAARRESAERVDLALRGGDLGLWDLHLPSETSVVNERWSSMLGLPHQPVDPGTARWRSLVHPDDFARVSAAQQAHIDGASPRFEQIYRMRHAEGRWVWILDRGQVVERAADGRPQRMVGTHMDITERMQAQRALADSEESLAITLQSIGDAVIATDAAGAITRMNAAAQRLTGWSAEAAVGQPLGAVFRIFNARSRAPALDPVQQVLAHGEVIGLANDTLLVARDGSEVQIADSAAPIRTRSGEVVGVVLVFSDVSERYRVEQALRQNERRLQSLLDNLGAGVIVHAADTRIVDANPAACQITGLSLEQLQGKESVDPYWAFLEEDGTPMPHERFPVPQVLASGEPLRNFIVGVRRSDLPRPVWVLCNAYPLRGDDGAIQQVFVTFIDVTERRAADEELRLLGAAVDRLGDVVLITEAEPVTEPGPRIVFVNPAFERLTGWSRAEVLGRTPRILQGPGTDGAELARIREALARQQPVHAELLNYSRQGKAYWVELDILPLVDRQGRLTHFVSIERDITERRRANAQLRAAQDELRATLDAIPDLLFELGADGSIHNIHAPRRELLYADAHAQIGRRVADVVPPDAAAVIMSALHQAELAGLSAGLQYELPLPGGRRWFELSVARKPAPGDAAPRFIVLSRDVTERKHSEFERQTLEHQLREAQKMESIGTLAGGIAHDFNNILAAILGNVALAREDAGAGHPVQASLDQINRAGLRARHLVQQILAFSRREQQGLSTQPLHPVVQETLGLLRATLPAGVRIDAVLGGTPVWTHADATQLQQVLMNLCTNAWHALPSDGGRIEVGLDRVALDESLAQRLPELHAAHLSHLWVRDNGSGMDSATRERIFDPFFTTKPVGQGTGLGLSVVHGIVRAHRGAIAVDTAPGQGSCFHLYIPSPESGPAAPEATQAAQPPSARGGGQRVLYVDDDDVMVVMVQRLLERAGFEVATETDSRAALARFREEPQAFDAVVTDFNMPELSGLEVARQIAALRPELPVVMSTGYLSEELRAQAGQAGVRAMMKKENTIEELAGLLQELLAQG